MQGWLYVAWDWKTIQKKISNYQLKQIIKKGNKEGNKLRDILCLPEVEQPLDLTELELDLQLDLADTSGSSIAFQVFLSVLIQISKMSMQGRTYPMMTFRLFLEVQAWQHLSFTVNHTWPLYQIPSVKSLSRFERCETRCTYERPRLQREFFPHDPLTIIHHDSSWFHAIAGACEL